MEDFFLLWRRRKEEERWQGDENFQYKLYTFWIYKINLVNHVSFFFLWLNPLVTKVHGQYYNFFLYYCII